MASFSRHTTRCLPRCLPECAFSCQLFLIALARGMHMAVVQLITHTNTHKEGQPQALLHLQLVGPRLVAAFAYWARLFLCLVACCIRPFLASSSNDFLLLYSLYSTSMPACLCLLCWNCCYLSLAADTNRRQFLLNLRAKLSFALQCASFHHE